MTRFLLIFLLTLTGAGSQAVAQEKAPLVLALDADLSAVAVEGGTAIRRGMEIAIAEVNNNGGVLGRQLSLVTTDHRGNPARGVYNVEQLAKRQDLLAIFGGVHTPVAVAELDAVHKNNLLFLSPWAAGTSLVDNHYTPNNVFRVSIRDEQAGEVLIKTARERGVKEIALVLERTGWGRSNLTSLSKAAEQQGLKIVSTQWINWRQTDFTNEMSAIIQSGAGAIILVSNAPEAAVVSKTLLKLEAAEMPLIAHWGLAGGDFVAEMGLTDLSKLDLSVIQTFSFLYQNNSRSAYLLKAYRERYDDIAPQAIPAVVGLAHSYDLVHILIAAVKKAGSVEADAVRQALENLPVLQGAVKQYAPAFTENMHDALMAEDYFMAMFNEDGHLIPVSDIR